MALDYVLGRRDLPDDQDDAFGPLRQGAYARDLLISAALASEVGVALALLPLCGHCAPDAAAAHAPRLHLACSEWI